MGQFTRLVSSMDFPTFCQHQKTGQVMYNICYGGQVKHTNSEEMEIGRRVLYRNTVHLLIGYGGQDKKNKTIRFSHKDWIGESRLITYSH